MKRAFDRKFGSGFSKELPSGPGVYFFYNDADEIIYVGKAKNLRRRLSQYRNAKRVKAHRKMHKIVSEAVRLEHRICEDHLNACLLESELIQQHRPRWNVAGAFYFLYPMIGMKWDNGSLHFCYTTQPESFEGFQFFGAFRSRYITREAYFSLMRLLTFVGHANRRQPSAKYSYVFSFRQLPEKWVTVWADFFKGQSRLALEELILALVENADARRSPRKIQEFLEDLARFWRHEAQKLARACKVAGYEAYPVPQRERDVIFLKKRFVYEEKRRKPAELGESK